MEQMPLDLGDSEEENRKKRIADAKAKAKEMAEEHRNTAKDERTYKKMGEPVDRFKSMADKVKLANLPEGTPNLDAALKKIEAQREQMEARRAARTGGGGGGGGGGGSGGPKSMKYEPKTFKAGGKVSSASKRADGCAMRGKTRGKIV